MSGIYLGAAAISVIGAGANQRDQNREMRKGSGRNDWQNPYFQDVYRQAGDLSAPDVSGSSALQGGAAGGFLDWANNLQGTIAPAQQASSNILQYGTDPSNNPAFQQYLQLANDQLTRQYQQQVAPALRNQAVAAGNVGSSRAGIAEGIARQGLTDAQGNMTADMTNRAYGQGLQAQLQALSLAPQTAGLGGMAPLAMLQAAAAQQGSEAGQYNQDMAYLQNYSNILNGGAPALAPTPQSSQLSDSLGLFSGLSGGIQAYRSNQPPSTNWDTGTQGDYQPALDTRTGTPYR